MNEFSSKLALILAVCLCSIGGLILWRLSVPRPPSTHAVIIADTSQSKRNYCACAVVLAQQITDGNKSDHSTLTLLGSGDGSTANEPRLLDEFKMPRNRMMLESRRGAASKRQQRLDTLFQKCEQAPATISSSIFLPLKRGVEKLNNTDLQGQAHHTLQVITDGQENAEPAIKEALNGTPLSRLKLPPKIDNRQVKIIFRGVAETVGQTNSANHPQRRLSPDRNAQSADRLRAVWLAVFTHPEWVSFDPFCPTQVASLSANNKP